jgi:hypothetical protein
MEGDLLLSPPGGNLRLQWEGLNLARGNPFLAEDRGQLTGDVTGAFQATLLDKEHLRFRGFNKGNLSWNRGAFSLSCPRIVLDLKGDEKGIEGAWTVEMAPQGRISGSFATTAPISMTTRPDAGRFESVWEAIDVAKFKPFFGKGTDLNGSLKGRLDGRIQGEHLTATGEVQMEGGRFSWRQRGRRVEAAIPKARLSLAWQGNALSGKGALDLAERGDARGSFVLPIPAVWPVKIQTAEALREVRGRLSEKGILSVLFYRGRNPGSDGIRHGCLRVVGETALARSSEAFRSRSLYPRCRDTPGRCKGLGEMVRGQVRSGCPVHPFREWRSNRAGQGLVPGRRGTTL